MTSEEVASPLNSGSKSHWDLVAGLGPPGLGRSEADMTNRVFAPLIIGITGKRDLKGKDETVRAALNEAFERLDSAFPNTPKILLSALAEGADTVAAEEALRRAKAPPECGASGCAWKVVGLLPFPVEQYIADFDQRASNRLVELCKTITTHVVAPLRRTEDGESHFAWAELARHPTGNPERTAHYEQTGLYIADQCLVLIAVMDGEERPAKIAAQLASLTTVSEVTLMRAVAISSIGAKSCLG
jgi:hypothetical protein